MAEDKVFPPPALRTVLISSVYRFLQILMRLDAVSVVGATVDNYFDPSFEAPFLLFPPGTSSLVLSSLRTVYEVRWDQYPHVTR